MFDPEPLFDAIQRGDIPAGSKLVLYDRHYHSLGLYLARITRNGSLIGAEGVKIYAPMGQVSIYSKADPPEIECAAPIAVEFLPAKSE